MLVKRCHFIQITNNFGELKVIYLLLLIFSFLLNRACLEKIFICFFIHKNSGKHQIVVTIKLIS